MTVAAQPEQTWLTMPVDDLLLSPRHTGVSQFFRKLPLDQAMFVPRKAGQSLQQTAAAQMNGFRNFARTQFPDRRVRSRQDKERNGVWFWWELREVAS